MNWKSYFKSVLPFLPLLVLYIVVVLVFSTSELMGDENRHVRYATNLTQGFFTDENNPELGNGPGYPLVIAPFLAIQTGYLIIKILNAILFFIGVVYFKKTLEIFIKEKYAIAFAYLLGIYPPMLRYIPLIYSEPLAFMIICGLLFHVVRLFQNEGFEWKHLILASFYLGFLVLVKIIFLHVIITFFLVLGCLFLIRKNKQFIKISIVIGGGLLMISPYLMYSYLLTGKVLYLGTGGGEILYHRSTPYENEWGNWFSKEDVLNGGNPGYEPDNVYSDLRSLSENHGDVYLKLEPLTHMQRDSAFKAIAIKNMKTHVGKYAKNTVANIGRVLFHYPFSYREQNLNAYGYLIPNMFIIVLWVLSLYPAIVARKKIPYVIKTIMLFTLIYFCGIVLLDGRGRNFIIMVPSLILFFAYVYTNILKINLVKTDEVK